jgi:hypothetical protein
MDAEITKTAAGSARDCYIHGPDVLCICFRY